MKRTATGLGIAALFIVVTATAALANHGIGSGTALCNPDGSIAWTFTVVSSGKTPGQVTTRLGDGTTPFTVSETTPGTQHTNSLVWHAAFHENSGKTIHSHGTIVVNFTPDCTSPSPTTTSPTPPPTTTPPTTPPSSPPTQHTTPPTPTTRVKGGGGNQGPGGTAFSGSNATPAAAAAIALLLVGLGFMWIARERAR